ncbi:MAG: response regulator [Bacteroidota bacterium]
MKKILLIEDDTIITKILVFLLRKEGFEIHTANDGNQGIEKIKEIIPDLIITDIKLPYKSGLEITAFSKFHYPKIPVIVVSVLGKEDRTVAEAYELGVDKLIAKPFNPEELIATIKGFLQCIA